MTGYVSLSGVNDLFFGQALSLFQSVLPVLPYLAFVSLLFLFFIYLGRK